MKTQFSTYMVIGVNLCHNWLSYVFGSGSLRVMLNQQLWLSFQIFTPWILVAFEIPLSDLDITTQLVDGLELVN